jgi:DNA-binding winged helix-turn-helix (wHTH) protein
LLARVRNDDLRGARSPAVELVRWPSEAVRRDHLASVGVPRLLLIEEGCSPPAIALGIEDWIRVPADERDLFVRMARLARQHQALHPQMPTLDDLVLRNGDRWTALSPREAGILVPLLNNFGKLVTRDEIGASGWADGRPRSLSSRMRQLRKRLAEVGLQISTVRERGFILDFHVEGAGNEEQ